LLQSPIGSENEEVDNLVFFRGTTISQQLYLELTGLLLLDEAVFVAINGPKMKATDEAYERMSVYVLCFSSS